MPPPLAAMRAQAKSVIEDWAKNCTLQRFNPSKDASGRLTGSYALVGASGSTIKVWVQPVAGNSQIRQQGLNAETTHLAFQAYDGTALIPKDRVTPSGETFEYDVVSAHVLESHRMAELKQVRRA